jgi:hypothetical protein
MAGRQSKLAMLQSSSSSTSLASTGEPGSSPGNRLLAPSAGKHLYGQPVAAIVWLLTSRLEEGLVTKHEKWSLLLYYNVDQEPVVHCCHRLYIIHNMPDLAPRTGCVGYVGS